ncbi:ubiquitin carboxyl-terminal hydrolase [Lasius niger]|uniref:Ubiquitin carboxyl-terminal hydrolase n=1 Tax=Lasius niger TaxID=67767 RepID=A0A0J7KPK6_LASNI|nr:ubiquitin carboxyl-terminal hydrolase [Lasius niger]
MSEQTDIIQAINELLGDPGYWDEALPPHPRPEKPPPTPTIPPQPRPPKVGTLIQRSDHVNRRKQAILLQPPPPPPKRRQGAATHVERPPSGPTTEAAAIEQPELLMPAGPLPPPPIPVQVEPGIIVEVPHFAVHVSRRYKPRTAQGRWILRFSRTGQLTYRRRLE